MTRKRHRGFTLIELLVVVAIIGVLSGIAIWNYFLAIDRAKSKKTMADMRSIALAWETYATENGNYIPAGAAFTFPENVIDWSTLEEALVPRYAKNLPSKDAWGRPFDIGLDSGFNAYYAIRSRGKDGLIDADYELTRTTQFECDIVYSNGSFVVYPDDSPH